ncbi:DUF1292 domain-containing protein [Domibacillus enclensis]|uniref:DUF1292 domain-containing protein n=1 Tax=Domibacillus enclensis TaxID=1017273 RepID=A0A1N6Y467_9BACI|nr:DUF1292 domain-containing protein [Domibacillus enclensis]OXS77506.1 DUF1292 domain-containing protein [Domibacillus enclensis]SIR09269.1 Protein of unknown function [Domibacillus enclensis]
MEKVQVGDVFTFVDENDQQQDIEVLGTMTIEGTDYAAAGFTGDIEEETGDEVDVFFFRIENDEQLIIVDEDDEFEKVSAAFIEAEEA